ncbi:MAG: hypothetical protein HYY37_01405 [Candidatus Aenigmarchaeota archaeon]|nr:hypothetical protein [Candidatus Aenigmarchaeota archaeon]
MRIVIRKAGMAAAVIITFHTRSERFDSDYERIKFFRGLHGWNQVVPKAEKRYSYRRTGILDEVPHVKIADSVFAVMMKDMDSILDYFERWSGKIDFEVMRVMMEKKKFADDKTI